MSVWCMLFPQPAMACAGSSLSAVPSKILHWRQRQINLRTFNTLFIEYFPRYEIVDLLVCIIEQYFSLGYNNGHDIKSIGEEM